MTISRSIPASAGALQIVGVSAGAVVVTSGRPDRPCSSQSRKPLQRAGNLLEGVVHRNPPGAEAGSAPKRGQAVAADVHRRAARLNGFGLEGHGVEVEEPAVVLDGRLGPQRPAHLQGLVHPGAAGGEIRPTGVPLLTQPTGADTELEPSGADDVQRRRGAGTDERVAQ